MSGVSTELIALLRYLLPGFLAAWVFYGFTGHEKSSQFERVVQAVIFTLIVQSLLAVCSMVGFDNKLTSSESYKDFLSVIIAISVGFLFALFANKDWLHSLLRKIHLTKQTSFPSEWYGTLNDYSGYVVLHLKDDRRLYGWPKEWPESYEKGHFYLVEISWLVDKEEEHYLGDSGVEGILLPIEEVRWVEFMGKNEE